MHRRFQIVWLRVRGCLAGGDYSSYRKSRMVPTYVGSIRNIRSGSSARGQR